MTKKKLVTAARQRRVRSSGGAAGVCPAIASLTAGNGFPSVCGHWQLPAGGIDATGGGSDSNLKVGWSDFFRSPASPVTSKPNLGRNAIARRHNDAVTAAALPPAGPRPHVASGSPRRRLDACPAPPRLDHRQRQAYRPREAREVQSALPRCPAAPEDTQPLRRRPD
jgi:hypothetical protein